MHNTEIPFWLQNTIICGREDDDGNEGEGDEGNEDEEEDEENEEDDTDSGSKDSDKDKKKSEVEELKAALAAKEEALKKERKSRRVAERDARRAAKAKEDKSEAEDLEATKTKLQTSETKTEKLAARLLNQERDNAILAEARKLNFIDPSDALTDDIREAIDVDQDDEDPSDIDIDGDSVKRAVKELANKKKHLIAKPNNGEASGGRFKKGGESQEGDEAKLKGLYSSLQ